MAQDKPLLRHSRTPPVLLVVIGIIVSFFIWASICEIPQHVNGMGRIIPSGKTRTVQHLEGGIVREIKVKEGDHVSAGQVLFVIDNVNASTDRNEALIKLHQLESRLIRLQAERADYKMPVFPDELKTAYPDIIDAEIQLFNARKREYEEGISVLQEQISQKKLKLDSLKNTQANLGKELSVAQEQMALSKRLAKAGAGSQSKFLEAQSRVTNFKTRISQTNKEIPITQAEMNEIQSKLAQASQQNEAEIIEKLNQSAFERKQIEERLNRYDDQVARANITAPVTGILKARHIDTVGGVIQPGGVLAEILPLEEQLIIEGEISTEDRPKVYQGLPVKIRISAYDFRRSSAIEGVLEQISADSFSNQQGQNFYKVHVSIAPENIPDDMQIYPGMIVNLHITAGRVTILHAILKPFWDLKNNALQSL